MSSITLHGQIWIYWQDQQPPCKRWSEPGMSYSLLTENSVAFSLEIVKDSEENVSSPTDVPSPLSQEDPRTTDKHPSGFYGESVTNLSAVTSTTSHQLICQLHLTTFHVMQNHSYSILWGRKRRKKDRRVQTGIPFHPQVQFGTLIFINRHGVPHGLIYDLVIRLFMAKLGLTCNLWHICH